MQMYLACHRRRHVGEPVVVDWQFVNDEGGLVVVSCCIKNEPTSVRIHEQEGWAGRWWLEETWWAEAAVVIVIIAVIFVISNVL
jgi:hypothetical protein